MPFVGFAAGLAAPELGPPGGSRFGPAFIFGDCPSQVFGIAMSGAAPFWGPSGGPRIGSADTDPVAVCSPCGSFSIHFRVRKMCGGREDVQRSGVVEM